VTLEEGRMFALDTTLDPKGGNIDVVGVAYKNLPRDVAPGDTLLLNDGQIVLSVESVNATRIVTRVKVGGELSDRKGLNRQGGGISAPALSDKDRDDIRFAAESGIDYIAVSFARTANDIESAALTRKWAAGRILADRAAEAVAILAGSLMPRTPSWWRAATSGGNGLRAHGPTGPSSRVARSRVVSRRPR
jgi:pyruvate kinase